MGRAVKWRFCTKTTRKERIKQRKGTSLRDATITERTQERYFVGLQKLLPVIDGVSALEHLDMAVSDWVELSWSRGETLGSVSDALCGLHHFEPWTRKQLYHTWKLFAAWRKLEGPSRAPPLTASIIAALANYAISHADIIFAALILLGFFGLLRTGEILQLRACDILVGKHDLIISLPNTKSGSRNNAAEMVQVDDVMTLETVREVILLRKATNNLKTPLWDYSGQAFRDKFAHHLRRFHLTNHQFRPYSMRRGGATHLFQITGSMEAAMLKGRWGSPKVAKIYIADALSYLPAMTFTDYARSMLKLWNPFSTHSMGQVGSRGDSDSESS